MIDHVELWIRGRFAPLVREHRGLDFILPVSERQGDVKGKEEATLGPITFQAKSKRMVRVFGSLHYLSRWIRDGQWYNYDQFTDWELFDTIHWLSAFLEIPPDAIEIHGIEIGFNLQNPPFDIGQALESIFMHSVKPLIPWGSGIGYFVNHGHYTLKFYDKRLQAKISGQVQMMRIEGKATRMQCLGRIGVKTLADLLDTRKLTSLFQWLYRQCEHLLVIDYRVNPMSLNKWDQSFWFNASNPRFWKLLKGRKLNKPRERLGNVTAKFFQVSLKQMILDELKKTFEALTSGGDSYRASQAEAIKCRGESYRELQIAENAGRGESYRALEESKKTGGGDSYSLDEREETPLPLSGDSPTTKPPRLPIVESPTEKGIVTSEVSQQVESWEKEIANLETFFSSIELPTEAIKLNAFTTITDVSKFIAGHLAIIKAHVGNRTFKPYLDRLIAVRAILKTTS